ncbi:MAG TPA: hypothetical protein VKE22_18865 [Haliangiales bacterium]|nr:hypothetical protein [Haliangiales bacterium]
MYTVFLCACGSSGSGTCGKVAPCGGNVVGDWTIDDACLSFTASPLGSFCPSGTVDAAGIGASGMFSFRSDLTYSTTITLSGGLAITIPESCLTVQGVTLTCAQLDQALKQALIQNPNPAIQAVSCQGIGGCVCTIQIKPQTSTSSGTYATSGTSLTLDGGSPSTYCVQASELHVMSTSMSMGSLNASGDVVMHKK